jgi:hypothetical protein
VTVKAGLYQHYKGPFYRVMEVATHSETEEQLVVYRALYGDKGVWVRPLSMFTETVERDGVVEPRFAYLDPQTEVLELVILDVKEAQETQFQAAFDAAKVIISHIKGHISHDLQRGVENADRYVLLIKWQMIENTMIGFRRSEEYLQWNKLLHPFYNSSPLVEHFKAP